MKPQITQAVENIVATIKNARISRGWTQHEIARRIGRGQSRVSDVESGEVDPRMSTVAAVARVVGLRLMLIPEERVSAVQKIIGSESTGVDREVHPTFLHSSVMHPTEARPTIARPAVMSPNTIFSKVVNWQVPSVYDEIFVPDPPSDEDGSDRDKIKAPHGRRK